MIPGIGDNKQLVNINRMYTVYTTAYLVLVTSFCLVLLYFKNYQDLMIIIPTLVLFAFSITAHVKLGWVIIPKIITFSSLHLAVAINYLYLNKGPVSYVSIFLALMPMYSILVTRRKYHTKLQIFGFLFGLILYGLWGAKNFHTITEFLSDEQALYITMLTLFLGVTVSIHLDSILLILEKQNEELVDAQKKLGAFLSNVSHQIKTPLSGIMGIQSLLESTEIEEDRNELYEILKHSSINMMRDMNNIMELSKIEGDMVNFFTEYFSVDEIIEDMQYIYKENVFNKMQSINYTPNNNTYLGDKSKVKLILENIVDNILTENKESEVNIEVLQNPNLVIRVEDPTLAHTSPYQIDANGELDHNPVKESSSLGLYMSNMLSNVLEGSFKTFNTHNSTIYELELPYTPLTSNEVTRWKHTPKRKVQNLLLVEDNAISRKIISSHFTNRDYKITTTVNGLEALEYIKNNYDKIDVIFMDIQMPVMDGITATKKIRSWEYKHSNQIKPIVALTANTMFEDKLICYSSGMNYFMGKPFNPQKMELLLQKIENNRVF